MRAGVELFDLARAANARTIFVVGTGRNVGKTTIVRALYAAARDAGAGAALLSLNPRHRLWLRPGTVFVTARGALSPTPAVAILKLSRLQSPAGTLLYAFAKSTGLYELVGPPTASGVREVVDELAAHSDLVIVDGAVDRVAAVAGSDGAIVVACGAAEARTMQEAVAEVTALVARLNVPRVERDEAAVEIDGALMASQAAALLAMGERRPIVVRDPTQIALSGKAATKALSQLDIRCRRPLRVIATTIASVGPELMLDPRDFAAAVCAATGLPAYDLFAGVRAA